MTKRIVNLDTGFEDQDLLRDIRREFLNKLAVKVKDIGDTVYSLDERAVVSATADIANKEIVLHRDDPNKDTVISLDGMFPETVIPDFVYPIKREDGSSINDIQTLKIGKGIEIAESHPSVGTGGTLELTVPSPWAKVGTGTYTPVKNFTVIDPNNKAKIDNDTLTWVIPKDYGQLQGQIAEGPDKAVNKIKVTGNLDGTNIVDDVLTITIPSGGSGGTVTAEGYFRGFFESLGDVESKVQNPTPGKTFVFVKDKLLPGDKYYTPYFFVSNSWTEVPTDPAITYTAPSSSQTQGVFSIKPDNRITIDANGQLDLSGLATDEAKLNFHGFYDTQEQLTAAVPRPVLDKSFAYVKHSSGPWVGKVYRNTGTGTSWQLMVPMGTVSLVESSTSIGNSAPIYGIAKNDDWEMKGNGILELKHKDAEISVDLVAKDGSVTKNPITTLKVEYGAPRVEIDASKKTAIIKPVQKVIQYDSSFEAAHSAIEWEGTIYYDETSRTWMGWGVPDAAGAVDNKWTRIAHRGMSDEVKDLSKRLPVKAPDVVAGVVGDAPAWQYTGWTYVTKDNTQLPEAFRERCGAYISTVIQDVPNDTARPQERIQICYADEQGGHCYVRRWFKGTDSGSSDQGWKPWVKLSMSAKDISDHNTDHNSHRDSFKFYKVGTLDMSWAALKAKNNVINDSDLLLLADSDGISNYGETTITVPYTGSYRFSGRIDFDGITPSGNIYPKPNFIVYVYKTVGSVSSIVAEYAYSHADHTKPVPPLQWKSGEIQLNEGDKIHFELKDFKNSLDSLEGVRFIPNRTFFVMEDYRTAAGSRIAETFRRTLGSMNAHYNVGVNVHYNSGTSGAIRVYGAAVTAQATNMTKV